MTATCIQTIAVNLDPCLDCGVKKFGEIVREMYDEGHKLKRYSQRSFAKRADMAQSTLWRVFAYTGIDQCNEGTIESLARGFGMKVEEFTEAVAGRMSGKRQKLPGKFTIPIVSKGAAGHGNREYEVNLMAEEGVPGALYPYPRRDPLAFRVDGNSMSFDGKESLEEGDFVVFCNDYEEDVPDGDLVVAKLLDDDSLVVKRVKFLDAERLQLVSQNARFDPIPLARDRVLLKRVKVIVNRRYLGHSNG